METRPKDITLQLVASTMKSHGRQLALGVIIASIVVLLITLSIPDYYRSDEVVGYEEESSTIAEGLRKVGLSQGFDTGRLSENTDAFFPPHYFLLLESHTFLAKVMRTKIYTEAGDSMTYYAYLRDFPQKTWWETVYDKITTWSSEEPIVDIESVDPTRLTPAQEAIFNQAAEHILCQANTKKNLVTVSVIDRDPLVCATMASAVCQGLHEFVETYRRKKMDERIRFYGDLVNRASIHYQAAVRTYNSYSQPHSRSSRPSSYTWTNHLKLRMMQEQTVLNALRSHYEYSASRLSEPTSLFAPIQQAAIPIEPSGPNRLTNVALTSLLTFILMLLYYLRTPLIQQLK